MERVPGPKWHLTVSPSFPTHLCRCASRLPPPRANSDSRGPPSSARMRMAQRVTEEDVLHATHLPTFVGQLSDEDADDS